MGQSEVIKDEKPMTARRLSEEELEEVVQVLQLSLGCSDKRLTSCADWRMRILDVESHLVDGDLPEPFDDKQSDFHPYFERIQQAWVRKTVNSVLSLTVICKSSY